MPLAKPAGSTVKDGRWVGPDGAPLGNEYLDTSGDMVPGANPIEQQQNLAAKQAAADAAAQQKAEAEARAQAQAYYDAHFQYGQTPGGAAEASVRFRQQGEAAQNRPGEIINYADADNARNMGYGARQGQVRMGKAMEQRAYGLVPSIAQMQADRQMGMAAAEQSSAAASARGPAALALAQQGAAANTAAMQSQISGQAQINAAQERLQAEQAAAGLYANMRQGDASLQGMAAQQAQAQAAVNAAQRAQNDQYQLGMTGYETGVQTTQLQAYGNKLAQERGMQTAQAQLAQAQGQHDDNRSDRWVGYGIGAGGTLVGVGATLWGSGVFGGKPGAPIGGSGGVAGGPAPSSGGHDPSSAGSGGHDPSHNEHYDSGGGSSGGSGNPDPSELSDISAKQNIRPMSGYGLMAPPQAPPRALPGPQFPGPQRSQFGLLPGPQLPGPQRALPGPQHGLMLSDNRAKAAAWDEGRQAAIQDIQKLATKTPDQLKAYGDDPLVGAVRGLKADGWDEGHGQMQKPAVDPATQSFAQGLAPSAYEYKPGLGTPGTKVGPMAQNMLANPITATAVRQDPQSGLLAIDRDDGLKVALSAGGHLAAKQAATDAEIAQLKQKAGLMEQGNQSWGQGLMSRGPSVGDEYLKFTRGGR